MVAPLRLLLCLPALAWCIRISPDLQSIPVSSDMDANDGLAIPEDAIGRPDVPPVMMQSGLDLDYAASECFCSYGTEDGVCLENETCVKEPGAACFHTMEELFNESTNEMETLHKYGCAGLEKGSGASHLICHAHLIPFSTPKSIACCYEGRRCNLHITPPPYSHEHSEFEYDGDGLVSHRSSLLPLIIICLSLMLLVGATCLLILWRKQRAAKKCEKRSEEDEELMIDSSGSGSRGGVMNQRTVAQDLDIKKVIGKGRYGEVRLALYRGSYVAVKSFSTVDEESWQNEREVYHSEMFTHENILQFVAADICSVDANTQMLLITDYHAAGSLSEYLARQEHDGVPSDEAIRLAFSIVCGLEHLHSSVYGTGGKRKPQIAHRDLKSRNIIVKRPGVCCIADFGLAVRFGPPMLPEKVKVQVGTKRYMAPEVLDNSMNPSIFNNFLMADIYSLALVLWEILMTVQLNANAIAKGMNRSNEHSDSSGIGESIRSDGVIRAPWNDTSSRTPFDGLLTADASFDDMIRVVCHDRKRPPIQPEWLASKTTGLSALTSIMTECWHYSPPARPSSLRVKLELRSVIDRLSAFKIDKSTRAKEERKDSACGTLPSNQ